MTRAKRIAVVDLMAALKQSLSKEPRKTLLRTVPKAGEKQKVANLVSSETNSSWRVPMPAKYDIFKKTPDNSVLWIEEVEDISRARKRLVALTSTSPAEYRLFDQSLEQFVDPSEDFA
jgi:hypothetical protein